MPDKSHVTVNTADREIIIMRVFDAPRELVWEVWTDPKHVAQWWGPNGITITTREMNVKPGGLWLFVMHAPNGVDYENRIAYTEVIKPERLVYNLGPDPTFHVTVIFEDQGDKTKVTQRAIFESVADCERVIREHGAVEGGRQMLQRLADYLAKM